MRLIITCIWGICFSTTATGQNGITFCNPMNLDYAYESFAGDSNSGSFRSAADPVLVNHKGTYYLFATNQAGYWWSGDLVNWNYIHSPLPPNESGDDMCAPAALSIGDTLLLLNSTWEQVPLYYSTDPKKGIRSLLADPFPQPGWDPDLFADDDGKVYLYWGSGNDPRYNYIKGVEVDPKHGFVNKGPVRELFFIDPDDHGWERFGENNLDTVTHPYVEGSWMTKFRGVYYLQYAAPGTEMNVYADGVYTAAHPLGPFKYENYNPFSFKPGGFARAAGHGSTMADRYGNYWHIATMQISVKYKFERRIGLFPAGFDQDGQLYCNTAFGDYPMRIVPGPADHRKEVYTGWMLLSFHKPAQVSSTDPGHGPELAFDEDIRTYWAAATGNSGEFLQVDLGKVMTINAIQVNYADHKASLTGKQAGIFHQYVILGSTDRSRWDTLVDKSRNRTDVPHDYTELQVQVRTRFLKLVNIHLPSGHFAIGDLRVFGKADGPVPGAVRDFRVTRGADRRNAHLQWDPVRGAYAYNVYFGIAADKLYNCMMVVDQDHLEFRGLNREPGYFFSIEAVGETGVSCRSSVLKIP